MSRSLPPDIDHELDLLVNPLGEHSAYARERDEEIDQLCKEYGLGAPSFTHQPVLAGRAWVVDRSVYPWPRRHPPGTGPKRY